MSKRGHNANDFLMHTTPGWRERTNHDVDVASQKTFYCFWTFASLRPRTWHGPVRPVITLQCQGVEGLIEGIPMVARNGRGPTKLMSPFSPCTIKGARKYWWFLGGRQLTESCVQKLSPVPCEVLLPSSD